MDTDPEIEDLKKTVARQQALIEDTNRMVHKLRRNLWWSRVWSVVWWLLIFGVSAAAYYYYVQPYIAHILAVYQSAAQGSANAQNELQNLFNQFASWFPHPSTTTPQQ